MSFVSCWLLRESRSISSEMSTAESSCTKRSSSILESSSAIGCSKLRKVTLLTVAPWDSTGGKFGKSQYSTGTGSRLRHMYQVATVRHGSQLAETSRASLRETGSPEK